MREREDALAKLDQVQYGLDSVKYRQERRRKFGATVLGFSGLVFLVDVVLFVGWFAGEVLSLGVLRDVLSLPLILCVGLSLPIWFMSLVMVTANASLGGTRDSVQEQLLLRERRKVLSALEVRGALQVHELSEEARGALTIDARGDLEML